MRVIQKYIIHPYDSSQTIKVGANFKFQALQCHGSCVSVWGFVDDSERVEGLDIKVLATGEHINSETGMLSMGTVVHSNGLVMHYFIV